MKRHGFTVIELLIASVITSMVAAAVISTMQAVTGSMEQQDLAADAMARAARAEARLADHVNRARLVLAQDADEVALWLPTEPFTSSATNTRDYDAINANELAWYVMDASTGNLTLKYLANRSDRTTYGLSTNWSSLRTTLQMQQKLTSVCVIDGLAAGQFRVEDADPCSSGRFTFDGAMTDARGGLALQLGGPLPNRQRHPDCP
jgi:prepilin-type N-terminal cleavage/methylation domain-containing protein